MKRDFKNIIVILLINAIIISLASACTEIEIQESHSASKYQSYIESIYSENSYQYETDINIQISEEGVEYLSEITKDDSIMELDLNISENGIYDITQNTIASSIGLSGIYNYTFVDVPNIFSYFIKDNTFCMDFESFYNAMIQTYKNDDLEYQYDNSFAAADLNEFDLKTWGKKNSTEESKLCEYIFETAIFNDTTNEADFIIDNTSATNLITNTIDTIVNNKSVISNNVNLLESIFFTTECQESLKEFTNQNNEDVNSIYFDFGNALIKLDNFLNMTDDEFESYIKEISERATSYHITYQCNSIIEVTEMGYGLSTTFTMVDNNDSILIAIIISCNIDTTKDASAIDFPTSAYDLHDLTNALFYDQIAETEEIMEEEAEVIEEAEEGTEGESDTAGENNSDAEEREDKTLDDIAREVEENAEENFEDNSVNNAKNSTEDNSETILDDNSENSQYSENHIEPPIQTETTIAIPTKVTKENIFNQKQKCLLCSHIKTNNCLICFYR